MIGLVTVNYNNALLTRALVASCEPALSVGTLALVVVDNASAQSDREQLRRLKQDYPAITVLYNDANVGYFAGINCGLDYLRSSAAKPSTIVIGNNDLEFSTSFFEALTKAQGVTCAKYPVIAPDIVTPAGRHQNPHVIRDISRSRMAVWKLYYSNYSLACIIQFLAGLTRRITERRDYLRFEDPQIISQGYGACYVLTSKFFDTYDRLWAPTFLMGEEFFLSKQVAVAGMHIFYDPSLVVLHRDHCSVSMMPKRSFWQTSRESYAVYTQYLRMYG